MFNNNILKLLNGKIFYVASRNMSITESIKNKIETNLKPSYLNVVNESFMHNVPKDSETHFKVVVVSDSFDNLSLIKRHRIINDVLKDELKNGVHALSIVALTNEQWSTRNKDVEPSPNCRGGFGK